MVSVLECRATGAVNDPAPVAFFIPKFISLLRYPRGRQEHSGSAQDCWSIGLTIDPVQPKFISLV